MNKTLAIVGALVLFFVGGFVGFNLHAPTDSFQAAGDTSSSAKIAQVVLDLSTTTPTTVGGACKLYNSDTRDRIINAVTFDLAGLTTLYGANGGIVWTWQMGTSTGVYVVPAAGSMILNTTVATTTPYLYVASTTPGASATAINRIWPAGTCLNVLMNGTSTAPTGNIRVDYSQGF